MSKFAWVITRIAFLLAIVGITGCVTPNAQMYPGQPKPSSEHAVIDVPAPAYFGRFGIVSVDGKMTVNFFTFLLNGQGWADSVTVLPGKHTIVSRYDTGTHYSISNLWLVAEPGGSYVLKVKAVGYGVQTWLEDKRTGARVGGISGSEDEPNAT